METSTLEVVKRKKSGAVIANRIVHWLSRNWLLAFAVAWGFFIGLPWLAPVFMKFGWTGAAKVIYLIYALECHQLPERSYFLFGPKMTYSLAEIQAAWQPTNNPLILRQFLGNQQMGWKVAWTDRMISFYGGWLLVGLIYALLRDRWRGLSLRWAIVLMLPLFFDGFTHMLSDLGGLREGFREHNLWLATLTNHAFAPAFYAGDQWGSFNSIMRLLSGLLGAFGLIGFAFPYIDRMLRGEAMRR